MCRGRHREKIKTEGGVVYGEIKDQKISKKVKKVLSSVLAATLVLGSVPASTFLGDAIQVRAAASYSPQKYGVGVLCRDLTTGDKAKEIFNALVRCKSKKEDSLTAVFTTMLVW